MFSHLLMKATKVSLKPVSHCKKCSFERVYIGDPDMKSEYFGGKHTLQLKPGADYILFDRYTPIINPF